MKLNAGKSPSHLSNSNSQDRNEDQYKNQKVQNPLKMYDHEHSTLHKGTYSSKMIGS